MANEDNQVNPRFVKELVYQPLEIITEYSTQVINNTTYNKLVKVDGMRPYAPDTKFKESCLLDMIRRSGEIEFLMVVTMYNEDKNNYTDTMHGIMDNLKAFQEDGLDPKLVGCIVIVDGIRPFSQTFRKPDQNPYFSNFFDEQMIRDRFKIEDTINGIPLGENQEIAHCFSANTNLGLEDYPELQLVFCVKQKNKRKLNTHLWFFGGFCEMIKPKFVMLIDVGTKPFKTSLCALYDVMKTNPAIAGVCGEIAPMDPQYANIVVSGQTVEYTFSHIFDKALESCLGYIGVLPGAFSAYRWEALEDGPLINFYFKTMTHPEMMDAYYSNIYLAEDRVLSLAIVSKPGTQYLLKFVHTAYAETDVPDKLFVLLSQRRRWINGSWFALIDTWRNFGKISNSYHTKWRKIWFTFELVYFTATILVSWVMVGNFYLFSELIFEGLFNQYTVPSISFMTVPELIMSIYVSLLLLVFMMSLGVKTARVEGTYKFIAISFAFYMLIGFIVLNYFTFSAAQNLNTYSIYLLAATIGSYAIGILITKNTLKILTRTVQFLAITPIYVNMFGIYAICNIHDCSWGNRPETMTEEEIMKQEEFQHYRTKWVIMWIITNLMYVKFMETLILVDPKMTCLTVVFTLAVILIKIRFIGCIYHYANWYLDQRSGAHKRYIHLTPSDNIAKENKQLLEELVSQVNKSKMISKKDLRTSMLETIERKGILRHGTTFQKNVSKILKQSMYINPDSDEDSESGENSSDQDSQILKELKSMRKSFRRGNTLKGQNRTTINNKKKIRRLTQIGRKSDQSLEEIEGENVIEEKRKEYAKKELESGNLSVIVSRKDEGGVINFEENEDFVLNPNAELNFSQAKLDLTNEGVLNFENSVQNNFVWDEPENESLGPEESDDITENSDEANKYLEMLSSIIKSISDDEDDPV